MITSLIFLLMLPIYVGYFFSILFLPLLLVAGIFIVMPGLIVWSIYIVIRKAFYFPLLLDDPRVLAIRIVEDQNPIVDYMREFPQFLDAENTNHVFGRRGIGDLLIKAQISLPPLFKFRLKKCFDNSAQYTSENALGTRLSMAHDSGAAIVITLVSNLGEGVEMGSFDWQSDSLNIDSQRLESGEVEKQALFNRHILSKALSGVGFVNNPLEWWNWCYGDQYWALNNKEDHAIYGAAIFPRAIAVL